MRFAASCMVLYCVSLSRVANLGCKTVNQRIRTHKKTYARPIAKLRKYKSVLELISRSSGHCYALTKYTSRPRKRAPNLY